MKYITLRTLLIPFAEFGGRDAGVELEIFAEGELFREAEPVGYLLHLQVALQQQVLGLSNDKKVNPLHLCLARVLLDKRRVMAHRQRSLGGIVRHCAPLGIMLRQHEVHKDLLAKRRFLHNRMLVLLAKQNFYCQQINSYNSPLKKNIRGVVKSNAPPLYPDSILEDETSVLNFK